MTGAAVQWLRDGLGSIESAAEIGPLAASVADNGGVYLVPAFTGLGSPWWDPYARGTIVGITRGTTKAHLARAVVEAMAYQTRDVVEAMAAASGTTLAALRVDGGASVMDLLLQMQADQLGVTVQRPIDQETTALGAAYLAGLAEGVWPSLDCDQRPLGDRRDVPARAGPNARRPRPRRMAARRRADHAAGSRRRESRLNRGAVVAVGSCVALLSASAASALDDIGSAVGASAPATRGTMVQVTPTLPPPVPRVLWIGDSSLEGLKFYSLGPGRDRRHDVRARRRVVPAAGSPVVPQPGRQHTQHRPGGNPRCGRIVRRGGRRHRLQRGQQRLRVSRSTPSSRPRGPRARYASCG